MSLPVGAPGGLDAPRLGAGGCSADAKTCLPVPWLTLGPPDLCLASGVAVILVVGIFALLKIGSGGKTRAGKGTAHGVHPEGARCVPRHRMTRWPSFPRSSSIGNRSSRPVQSTAMDRAPVPLPRPRPKPVVKRMAGPL